jgi:hypothetical protein
MILTWDEIPDDLEDMLEEGEFRYIGPVKFKKAMLMHGFFDYAGLSRSHIVVTDKADKAGSDGIIEALTGISMEEHQARFKKEREEKELADMFRTAKKHGYIVTKK